MNILIYDNASIPVRNAINKLLQYAEADKDKANSNDKKIKIELSKKNTLNIGRQGYLIYSIDQENIVIKGNSEEGITNGLFTMIRNMMIKNVTDPFELNWDLNEKPWFSIRNINIATYRFGGSFGLAILSPDRWSINEWIEYIDLMRLCNMTSLTINTTSRIYHPDYLQTIREKWRYDVWREVISYCHKVGMKCNIFITHGGTPQEIYWNNPGLRAVGQEAGGYFGSGLMWRKAKDLILDVYNYMFDYLNGMDGLEMIYSEAGFSFDDKTSQDPGAHFIDVTNSYRDLLKDTGNLGEFFYWNWVFDLWSEVVLPESLLKKYPQYRTILDDLLPRLPKDIGWIDASMLSVIQMFGPEIQARGNPGLREGVLLGKENGFNPVINCFWYMNPEYSLNMLPHPYINRAIQEALYSKNELKPDGVCGYRLAPPCRFLGDYTFFRLASDPTLSQEDIMTELSGILCKQTRKRKNIKQAIGHLEEFWLNHDYSTLEKADGLFNSSISEGDLKSLKYINNGTTFLSYIVKMAQPGTTDKQKKELKKELYVRLKSMYIFQGITSDIVWQPESYAMFNARVDLMINQYNWYKTSRPDLVDRNIYPDATSKRTRLNWQSQHEKHKKNDWGIGEMPGPLTI